MAGGTWTSQNKAQPGVYINTKSQGNIRANIGTRGIVAIAEPLSWGPSGIVQTIIPGEDLTPYIGYDITSEKALFLREMMKGSDTTGRAIKNPSIPPQRNQWGKSNCNNRDIDRNGCV